MLPISAPASSHTIKDAVTAYAIALDKFFSFHSTLVKADGSTVSTVGFKIVPEDFTQESNPTLP